MARAACMHLPHLSYLPPSGSCWPTADLIAIHMTQVWSDAEHEFFCNTRGYAPEIGVPCGGLVDMFGEDVAEAPNELRKDFDALGLQ